MTFLILPNMLLRRAQPFLRLLIASLMSLACLLPGYAWSQLSMSEANKNLVLSSQDFQTEDLETQRFDLTIQVPSQVISYSPFELDILVAAHDTPIYEHALHLLSVSAFGFATMQFSFMELTNLVLNDQGQLVNEDPLEDLVAIFIDELTQASHRTRMQANQTNIAEPVEYDEYHQIKASKKFPQFQDVVEVSSSRYQAFAFEQQILWDERIRDHFFVAVTDRVVLHVIAENFSSLSESQRTEFEDIFSTVRIDLLN